MPDIAKAAAQLNVTSAILDGEAVALDDRGVSDFAALQAAFQEGAATIHYLFCLRHIASRWAQSAQSSIVENEEKMLAGVLPGKGRSKPVAIEREP